MAFTVENQYGAHDILVDKTKINIDGDQRIDLEFPADDIVRSIQAFRVRVRDIATMMTNPELFGPALRLNRGGASAKSTRFLGAYRWVQILANQVVVMGRFPPGILVWPTDELEISFTEVDVNATVAGDLEIFFECTRIRDIS